MLSCTRQFSFKSVKLPHNEVGEGDTNLDVGRPRSFDLVAM